MQIEKIFYRFKYLVPVICLLFVGLIVFVNIKGILLNCFHATDFGIYQQAIYDIAYKLDLNPFVSVRNIKIFNDHFDPIIFLATPFVYISNYSPVSLILFELLWLFVFFIFLYKKAKSFKEFLLFLSMTMLTKGILTGFLYPIHPSTWSILPAMALGYNVIKGNLKWVVINSILLMMFKEAFAFGIVGLSGYYLFNKHFKPFFIIFTLGVLNIAFVYFGRPFFFGEISSYASMVLGGGILGIIKKTFEADLLPFAKVLAPFIIPLLIVFKGKKPLEILKMKEFGVIFYFIPLFLIHLITNKIHFQYGVIIVVPLMAIIYFSENSKRWIENKKVLYFVIFSFFVTSMGTYTKTVKAAFTSSKSCSFNKNRMNSIDNLNNFMRDIKGPILSTGGAIPSYLRPGMEVYQAGLFKLRLLDRYDYMLIEKPDTGNHYPYTSQQISEAINICKDEEKIIDDEWFLLIKNPSEKCFKTIQ